TEEMERFKPDGIMLSNGPGNPENMPELINAVQTLKQNYPLFGIGLGYELIALAYGAKLRKLHVSNYGVNMSVKNLQAKKTSFTTLSHDYIVDESSLPVDFDITHRILHDQAIAGLKHQKDAVMGIQFHPEGAPGTDEMKDLFTTFLDELVGTEPINEAIEKILVIGSGPIIIGQAAEFDYSGTQACHALKEEGYTVILANSNPATIMTDETVADEIYMEPLTVEFLAKIIRKERPD